MQRFHVTKVRAAETDAGTVSTSDMMDHDMPKELVLENEHIRAVLNPATGSLIALTNLKSNTTLDIQSKFGYYQSYNGKDGVNSGAYIFRPNTSHVHDLPPVSSHGCDNMAETSKDTLNSTTAVLSRCWFRFGSWGALNYILHAWETNLVVEWTVFND
jgi:hypothetical protein